MPVEIQYLVCTVALLVVIILIDAVAGVLRMGPITALGNRDNVAPAEGWAARVKRCEANQVVSLVLFTPLVLATVLLKQTDNWSSLGSTIYLYARVGFAACYLIGIPYLRTLCWLGGMVGIALVGYSLYA